MKFYIRGWSCQENLILVSIGLATPQTLNLYEAQNELQRLY
jgi:hypothetical protein